MFVALQRASCVLALMSVKRTGCDVMWQLECQAGVQSDYLLHGYIL